MKYRCKQQFGFSLIEMSVVLSILGLILAIVFRIIPEFDARLVANSEKNSLLEARSAIKGFLVIHSRLPCPDSDNDGIENCTRTVRKGLLPYKTMGLDGPLVNPWGNPLAYGVYRAGSHVPENDTDLSALVNRYDPHLPDGTLSRQSNGIDFCWALRTGIQKSHVPEEIHLLSDTPVNMAFIIADPGKRDSDDDGRLFDKSNNKGVGFETPSKPWAADYDDQVLGTSMSQLAGEFNCPTLLSHINGLSRAVLTAMTLEELAEHNSRFRQYTYDLAVLDLDSVNNLIILASIDVALATAEIALATANSIGTLAAAAPGIVLAVAAEATAITNLTFASADVASAKERIEAAEQTLLAAQAMEEQARQQAIDAKAYLLQMDRRGWLY